GFVKTPTFFYAATEEGLKRTSINTQNPADFRAWQNVAGTNGLSASPAKAVVLLQNKTIVLENDSLFAEANGTWTFFFANGWPVTSVNSSQNNLLLTQRKPTGEAHVVVLNAGGTVQKVLQQAAVISSPKKAIAVGTDYWIADLDGGLSHYSGSSFETFKL